MTELYVLKSIAENLSDRKSSAALSNYEVLCNNIQFIHQHLIGGLYQLKDAHTQLTQYLDDDNSVLNDINQADNNLYYFRKIIPAILRNDLSVIEKFTIETQPDSRNGITVEDVWKLQKTFFDYNSLVTSARQYIDSLLSNAYLLIELEPKLANFQILSSLNSFNKYATKSIKQSLFNERISEVLAAFEGLSYREKIRGNESNITKCSHINFRDKTNYVFQKLNIETDEDLKNEINNLFSFSSEFTHIGYVSTLFTNSPNSEVIFTDDISPYLPSTENFNELKYEILETSLRFLSRIYIPSMVSAINQLLKPDIATELNEDIKRIATNIEDGLKTRNNEYYFFIVKGLIGSKKTIDLPCICGHTTQWKPPHDLGNIYCKKCGAKFNLLELEGDSGYILTSKGPVKPIGSSSPDFVDLSIDEQMEILKKLIELNNQK